MVRKEDIERDAGVLYMVLLRRLSNDDATGEMRVIGSRRTLFGGSPSGYRFVTKKSQHMVRSIVTTVTTVC